MSTPPSRTRTRPAIALAAVALLVMALVPSLAGAQGDVIAIDALTSAEGIATGEGSTFYVGDLSGGGFDPATADADARGDIYRGDYATGEVERFIDAPADGRFAVGLSVDVANGILWVAGGPSGNAYAYATATGEELAVVPAGEGFVNDVIATDGGAWITNSNQGVLTFAPVDDAGAIGDPESLELSGPAADTSGAFNLNGIESVDADTLIVAHSSLGGVYTVDTATGETAEIALDRTVDDGGLVGADGILLDGDRLFVVENAANRVVAYDLSADLASAALRLIITDEAYNVPTTVAPVDEGRIATVNAQFGPDNAPTDQVFEVVIADLAQAEQVGGVTGDRISGPTRIDTAVAISQYQFPDGAGEVYLARADESADAVAGGSLTGGPILLVPSCGELPAAVADEIVRLGVDSVIALGGEGAVCQEVLDAAVAAANG